MDDKNKVVDITWQIRRQELKLKAKEKFSAVKNWCANNSELAIAIGTGVAGVIGWGVKTLAKAHSQHKEELLKNNYCYDRSLGHYWKLKRELTNSEWVEIDQRKKSGERLADILDSLKVLK